MIQTYTIKNNFFYCTIYTIATFCVKKKKKKEAFNNT